MKNADRDTRQSRVSRAEPLYRATGMTRSTVRGRVVADLLGFDGERGILPERAEASGPSVMEVITHRRSSELSSRLAPESLTANETITESAIAQEVR